MIIVFGKQGQLAQAFRSTLPTALKEQVHFVSSQEADFEKPHLLDGFLDHYGPSIVVVCSAYTLVDKAEEDRERAEKINHQAPAAIARWCAINSAKLIMFSTDYVFSGKGDQPWKESDATAPLNCYGETKVEMEEALRFSGCQYLVFRLSWVYSEFGKNFVKTMLQLGQSRELLQVVDDQIGSPTYAPDVAKVIWSLLQKVLFEKAVWPASGIYHLTGRGFMSWAEFAKLIFQVARANEEKYDLHIKIQKIEPVLSIEFPSVAVRPKNSRLSGEKVKQNLGIEMPIVEDSLKVCLQKIYLP